MAEVTLPTTPVNSMYFPNGLDIKFYPINSGGGHTLAVYKGNPDFGLQAAGVNEKTARTNLLVEMAAAYWRLASVPREKLKEIDARTRNELEQIAEAGETSLPSIVVLGAGKIGSTPYHLLKPIIIKAKPYESVPGVHVEYHHPQPEIVLRSIGLKPHKGISEEDRVRLHHQEAVNNLLMRMAYRLHGFEKREFSNLDTDERVLRGVLISLVARDEKFVGDIQW